MRTAYQGMQFDLMRKELRRPVIKSIDALLSEGFEVYATKEDPLRLNNTEFGQR